MLAFHRGSAVLWSLTAFSRRMSGQAKISAFFQPQAQKKRTNSSLTNDESGDCSPKKSKQLKLDRTDEAETIQKESNGDLPRTKSPETSLSLSPEQKKQIEENKELAQMRLVSAKTHGLVCNMGASWLKALQTEFAKPYFEQLGKFVSAERQKHAIYPPEHQVFAWTKTCDIRDVKVVILGQDPYHGPNQAHGLCFSVQKGVPAPPSLVNMYKELAKDFEGFEAPGHGNLMGWAQQGVLLLNSVLTVRAHQANSHKDHGWEKLTDSVITWLNRNLHGVVFLLWGAHAQKKGASIDKKKHYILKAVHPSPLSAHRGFFGCKHFSQTNQLLSKQGKKPIDWSRLPLR